MVSARHVRLAICVLGAALPVEYLAAQPRLEGLSLEGAIEALEAEGLRVFYSSELVKLSMRVTAQPDGEDLRELLRAILAPHGLAAAPGPRGSVLIVAAPSPAPPVELPEPRAPPREPVPDRGGTAPRIDELVVAASRYEIARRDAGTFSLSSVDLEQLPDLGDDALRAVQRLPGVATNGVTARANLRGGGLDETLVRFDKLRLYEPFHLESFQSVFSTIDPRVVRTMEVYTGAFPAVFGDRMSGVVDVTSLEPTRPRYHEVGVSFFNASLLSAGEFANGGGAWLASIRRSNLDLLYDAFSRRPERPRYLDSFGKVEFQMTDALRISVNALYSEDDVQLADDLDAEERASARDRDRYTWMRLDHTVSNALRGSTLLAHTRLSADRNGVSGKEGIDIGRLVDRRDFTIDSLQSDWSWQPRGADEWLVQFGATLGRSRGRYHYEDEVEFQLLFDTPGAPRRPIRERNIALAVAGRNETLYGSVRYRPAARLIMDLGLRWEAQTLDPAHTGALAPRAGLRLGLAERTHLRAGWGRFEQPQAINELAVGDGERQFFAPQRAEHRVLGLEHTFETGINLRVEAYEKEMSKLRPRYENLLHSLTLLPELKPDRVRIAPLSAVARGIEVRLDGAPGARLDWWAGYSRSSVRDRVGAANVFRSWDQARALSGGLSATTAKWQIGAALAYHSGWPRTAVLGLADDEEIPTVVTGPRNAERGDAFRSVDLRFTRMFATRRGELSAFLELNNAFDRNNRCCFEYELQLDDDSEMSSLELSPVNYLPRVTSLGFVWSF